MSGFSNRRTTNEQTQADGSTPGRRFPSPTLEEFVAAGYPAADYPTVTFDIVNSPGLVAFRAWQASPHDAVLHAAAAAALGVEVGELTHGRVSRDEADRLRHEPINLSLPTAKPARRVDVPKLTEAVAERLVQTAVAERTADAVEVEAAKVEAAAAVADADLSNPPLTEAQIAEAQAAAAAFDGPAAPAPLTDDEAAALRQTESLGGVTHIDREADGDAARGRKRGK